MKKLKGVVPPMVTPFKKNGEVDYESLKTLVTFLKDKVNGLFITGSYGSGALMNVEERKKIAETVISTADNDISIVVQTGTTNTRDSIELSVHAKNLGAQAVGCIPPYYFIHNKESIINYFADIVKAVGDEFPVYVYNNTRVQGFNMDYKYVQCLKDVGVKGIKDATMNIMEHANFHRVLKDDNFDVVSGTEAIWIACAALGCDAFMPGLGNAFPEACQKLYNDCAGDDIEQARKTHFWVNQIRDIMYEAPSTQQAVYAMLEIRGVLKAYPRAPFLPISNENLENMRTKLIKLEVIK